jgi:uncharacterized protein YacL
MPSLALEDLLFYAGFFLIFIFLSEEFKRSLHRLSTLLKRRPRLKYLAYPLGVLLFLVVAALIIRLVVHFVALRFSYD